MSGRRRLAVLLVVLLIVAAPAVALRAACAGKTCQDGASTPGPVPFCSLDRTVRDLLVAGFREGRGPDVLAVTRSTDVTTDVGGDVRVPWPSEGSAPPQVPLAFLGPDIRPGSLPEGVSLDQVAPTLEPLLGLTRPHPGVRSGRAIEGVVDPKTHGVPLVVMLVWDAAGLSETAVDQAFTGAVPDALVSGVASIGSLPLDPAAVLATIGSGGIPSEHGVTGTTLRDDTGGLARAFSSRAPVPVIAALGDDLDREEPAGSFIGLVGGSISDRGLIGGTWYGGKDDDRLDLGDGSPVKRVEGYLEASHARSVGAPEHHDLLGVVLRGDPVTMAGQTRRVIAAVRSFVPDAAFMVTTTGAGRPDRGAIDADDVVIRLDSAVGTDVVAGAAVGGLFLDADAMAAAGLSAGDVATELRTLTTPDGSPMFADVFPAFAVEFARYC